MLTVVFDFRKIHQESRFYQQLLEQTSGPASFGYNLDALWDWLTGGMALPAVLELNHLPAFPQAMVRRILPVLVQAAEELPGQLSLSFDGEPQPSAEWQQWLTAQETGSDPGTQSR